jgi:hypothetical protein
LTIPACESIDIPTYNLRKSILILSSITLNCSNRCPFFTFTSQTLAFISHLHACYMPSPLQPCFCHPKLYQGPDTPSGPRPQTKAISVWDADLI